MDSNNKTKMIKNETKENDTETRMNLIIIYSKIF